MKLKIAALIISTFAFLGPMQANAASVSLSLTLLGGQTPQATGVFQANLSGLGLTNLASISLTDDGGTSGSPGIWSGFDLAGIKLSHTDCSGMGMGSANCAAGLAGLNVNGDIFDFVNDVLFTPGTMDATGAPLAGPCLAGTSGVGCDFDNSIATLGDFDAIFDGVLGTFDGFLSLGRGGNISFNLTSLLALGGSTVYLYVGEVGNNGEKLTGSIEISDISIPAVPIPAAIWLFGTALIGFVGMSRRRKIT